MIVNDVEASNGVIHIIDEVLLPPPPVTNFTRSSDVELLKRIDRQFESNLKSTSGGKPVSISFCNLSPSPIQVFWIDINGKRKQWRGKIAPGKLDVCERTYENHVWLIADEHGKALGLHIAGRQNGIIVNTQ